eukprot:TRINITY_DN3074_c0_g1_i3.p1 TRINITY_DN3074_c0_g1~~TRINITY_DN3074_c0_g1_i3.p1  ORF type:complete len:630 (+),score=59.04 TRINITY_DN3074_c0_g1_i3:140-1891(+)
MGSKTLPQLQRHSWSNQCCGPCACTLWGFFFIFLGGIFILVSFFAPPITEQLLRQGIRDVIVWQPNSNNATFLKFSGEDPSQTGYMKFYFWNITNLEEVRSGGKFNLTQIGPFCYNKYAEKYDIKFDSEGRVYFNEFVHYSGQLMEENCLNETTVITTPNLALLGMLSWLKEMHIPKYVKDIISNMVAKMDGDLFMQRPVKELLWGYTDSFLQQIDDSFGFLYPSLHGIARVALLNNQTSKDTSLTQPVTVMDTGMRNISNVMQYVKWHNVTEITSWNGSAEQIHGTNAYQFEPGLTKDSVLAVWTGELYRVAYFEYLETTYLEGIKLYRFKPSKSLFEINPKYDQTIYGLLNVTGPFAQGPSGGSSSTPGPQIFISLPYYCGGDPRLLDNLNGIECMDSEHQLYVDVEPTMGTTMHAQIRLQMSTFVSGGSTFRLQNMKDTIVPIFWTEQTGRAQQDQITQFKNGVVLAFNLLDWFSYALSVGVGTACCSVIFLTIMLYQCCLCCGKKQGVVENERHSRTSSGMDYTEPLLRKNDTARFDENDKGMLPVSKPILPFYHHTRTSSVQPRTPSESEEELVYDLE